MAAPSEKDLFDAWKAEQLNRRPDLNVFPGSILEMLGYGAVAPASRLIGYSAERAKTMFLDGCSGEDLTNRADDYFNVQRNSGAFASATVTFTRAGSTAGTLAAGFRVATVRDLAGNEVRFALVDDLVFLTTDTVKQATVTAEQVGTAGNVAVNTITRLLDTPFDLTMVCTNSASAGGADAETDEELRERCRKKINGAVRGVLGALETGALTVASVKSATASEDASGIVTVYIADASGNSNAGMITSVRAVLAGTTGQPDTGYAAGGAAWSVVGGVLQSILVDLTVYVRSGLDKTAFYTQIRQAVVARLAKLRAGEPSAVIAPGGEAVRNMIRQAAMNVDVNGILNVVVNTPAAPLYPTTAQSLIRTTIGSITFT